MLEKALHGVAEYSPALHVAHAPHVRSLNVEQLLLTYCCAPHAPLHAVQPVSRYVLQLRVTYSPVPHAEQPVQPKSCTTLQLRLTNCCA